MRRHSVLVIEDSLTIRGIIERVLENDGGCDLVGPCSDVEHARILLSDRRPDVITLDLALPGMDGMQFLDELRGGNHPPVVVLSSSTRAKSAEEKEVMKRGAVACFDKANLVAKAPRLLRVLYKAVENATC